MEEIKKENIFKRITVSLGRNEVKTFVFFLSILILSWPFISDSVGRSLFFPLIYFFSVWAALILFLFISHLKGDKKED
jgi:hypothetical protein